MDRRAADSLPRHIDPPGHAGADQQLAIENGVVPHGLRLQREPVDALPEAGRPGPQALDAAGQLRVRRQRQVVGKGVYLAGREVPQGDHGRQIPSLRLTGQAAHIAVYLHIVQHRVAGFCHNGGPAAGLLRHLHPEVLHCHAPGHDGQHRSMAGPQGGIAAVNRAGAVDHQRALIFPRRQPEITGLTVKCIL